MVKPEGLSSAAISATAANQPVTDVTFVTREKTNRSAYIGRTWNFLYW